MTGPEWRDVLATTRRLRWLASAAAVALVAACGSGGGGSGGPGGGPVRVSGSTTVNPVAADAAEVLRRQGLSVTVDSQGGSAGGIAQLGAGQVEIAMSSKAISDDDRARFPEVDFVATEIGQDALGVIVRREVVDGGVRSLDREQLKAVFEGRVENWRELGGPDLEVFVYDKEPGRGTREVLDQYLYGADGKAPPPPGTDHFAIVGGNEETRTKLLSTPGSVGPLSSSFADGYEKLAAIALDGVEPTPDAVRNGTYPMARPLFLVTDGPPAGPAKRFVDFVVSPEGQQLVARHGFLTLADLGQA
jgi:phosphate transport system substrate-binding protein